MKGARVISLDAMIWKWLTGNLAACYPAAVCESRDKQRVDGGVALKVVEDVFDPFIDKRYSADLDANGLRGDRRGKCRLSSYGDSDAGCRCVLDKGSSIHEPRYSGELRVPRVAVPVVGAMA